MATLIPAQRDLTRVLSGIDPRHTRGAAERLSAFERPALLAWAPEDRLFPYAHAERLAQLLPDVRLKAVPDSYTFVAEDQPQRPVELIRGFAGEEDQGAS